MENLSISIRRGETLEYPVEADDESAVSVRLLATNDDGDSIFDLTEPFVDGEATLRTDETFVPLGAYEFTLTVTYSDDVVDILPDPDGCDGECELPILTVCKSNIPDPEVVS